MDSCLAACTGFAIFFQELPECRLQQLEFPAGWSSQSCMGYLDHPPGIQTWIFSESWRYPDCWCYSWICDWEFKASAFGFATKEKVWWQCCFKTSGWENQGKKKEEGQKRQKEKKAHKKRARLWQRARVLWGFKMSWANDQGQKKNAAELCSKGQKGHIVSHPITLITIFSFIWYTCFDKFFNLFLYGIIFFNMF